MRVLILICITILFTTACQPAESDDERLKKDKAAIAELDRLHFHLQSSRPVTTIDLEAIARLQKQYPQSLAIRGLMQSALIKREDWSAAEKSITELPESQRTEYDRFNLAKVYMKQGRFAEAVVVLENLRSGERRVESSALLGQAQFFTGSLDDSIASLESVRSDLVRAKRGDDLALLGLAYHRRGDNVRAIEVLKQAIEVAPENVSAHSALVRAYTATGDQINAAVHTAKLEEINNKIAATEKKKARLVPLYYRLEDAYAAKEFDKVIALVDQIRPEADDATMSTLYQYLAAAYRAQGKEAEAQNALNEAARLTKK